ncbi:MAG: hypothetical protein PHT80_01790 [Lentisphaeria bacterium]|nr:hypothetical protein [Lentisphaeria bacterium]
MTIARVEDYHGYPAIMIDGRPYPPMMATIRTNLRSHLVIDKEYFRELGAAGVKLFFLICDTEWLKPGAFAQFREEAEALLEVVPDAYIIPRIGLHPPLSWFAENPDELVTYSDGKHYPTLLYTESYEAMLPAMYSLSSQKWRDDAGRALAETYDAIEKLPYADRVVGYFLAAGNTSEWYYTGVDPTADGAYSDFSAAFRKEFGSYLREKYGTEERLRARWHDPSASFAAPTVPAPATRYFAYGVEGAMANPPRLYSTSPAPEPPSNGTNIGVFLDVDRHQATADYYRAWHLGTAKSVVHFARIIKAKSADKLVGAFYGSFGCTNLIDGGTAGGVLHILDSGVVDFLAAPGVYENRQPGGFTGQREMNDSFRLRNRMFIVEEDTRTHFENRHYQNLIEMFDMTDTYGIMKRDFGRNICEDLQAWWFDQHVGGGRYKHPDIYALIARQQEIARFAYSLDRRKGSEIAFIYDEESIHVTAHWASLDSIEMTRNYEIAHIGAPVDQYYHNDMANPAMPAYKLYVFFNVYSLSDQERRDILAKLKRDHAVALWLYAPGVINPDRDQQFSHEYLSELTGMRSAMLLENWGSKFKINGDAHPAFAELDKGQIFGSLDRRMPNNVRPGVRSRETSSYPVFYMDDPTALTAARFLGNCLPALSVKAMDGWTSVYCGAKFVRAELYRALARYAGCHIFSDDGDCLYASRNFVTVHAANSGEKCLRLPAVCSPYELYERQTYGEDTREIRFSMLRGETKMFSLVGKD